MTKFFSYKFLIGIVGLGSLFILNSKVFACSCLLAPPCVAYSESEKVFIGELEEIIEDKNSRIYTVYGRFRVERSFKGNPAKTEKVKFEMGSCERKFTIGETYFVYVNNASLRQYCDRTNILSESSLDLDYVNSLSKTSPKYSISGDIIGLSELELNELNIKISDGDVEYEVKPDQLGQIKFDTTKDTSYNVRISIPFKAFVDTNNVIVNNTSSRTTIEYKSNFIPNGCSYRRIRVSKIDDTPTSNIFGKVVDKSGNAIPRLYLYLYPYKLNQDFTSDDYELAKTNDKGEYIFRKVKPGNYIFGTNLGRTPDFDTPFPETFFPSQKTFNESGIITVSEKQDLTLPIFVIPPRLKTVKISGKLVWEDGTPVAKFSPNSESEQKAAFYLIDPLTFKRFDSFTYEGRNPIELDNQGNFSFLGYKGYSYIIHAHAFNFDNKPLHAKHIIVKASENVPLLTLKLSLEGKGENITDIKRELP